jgi:hypothetical protein
MNPRVVVARHFRRRGAVAQAWALLADLLRAAARPTAEVLTTRHGRRATHADTLSATLDALLAAGVEEVRVLADAHDFAPLGYAAEAWGRPVRLVDRGLAAPASSDLCRVVLAVAAAPILPAPTPALYLLDAFHIRRRLVAAGPDPAAVARVATGRGTLDPASIEIIEAVERRFTRATTPHAPHTPPRRAATRPEPASDT